MGMGGRRMRDRVVKIEAFEEYKEEWKNRLSKLVEDAIWNEIKNQGAANVQAFEWELTIYYSEEEEE